MALEGTTLAGPELLLVLRRDGPAPLRAQLEEGLRAAVRDGRLAAGARLPASRLMARDLGVSRRLVVEAYEQLAAEGYLEARTGAGTYVRGDAAGAQSPAAAVAPEPSPRFDFFPGAPDLAGFPRGEWLRCLREVLRRAPDHALGYPDVQGAPELRSELAAYLRRARGVDAAPERIVICTGAVQALAVLVRALGDRPRVGIEDPYVPDHRLALDQAGADVVPLPVDSEGLRLDALEAAAVDAVVATPAHQCMLGMALSRARRAGLAEWARGTGFAVEDDFDAEFRYDRIPLGAVQGLAPDRVVYLGSASKVLAPALRLTWLVLPAALVGEAVRAKRLADRGTPTLEQLALARLIATGRLDRHLRIMRRRYRARRDALAGALAELGTGWRLEGVSAGLAAVARPPAPVGERALFEAARARSVGVYPVGWAYAAPRPAGGAVLLGYAGLPEPAIREGVRRLAGAYRDAAG